MFYAIRQSANWITVFLVLWGTMWTHGPRLLSRTWSNIGNITLYHDISIPGNSSRLRQFGSKAEAQLRQALVYDAKNQSAWRTLGLALAIQGHEARAVAIWKTFGVAGSFVLASASSILGFLDDRQGTVALWQAFDDAEQFFVALGDLAFNARAYQSAESWYKQATIVEPSLGDTWYSLGLYYTRRHQASEADLAYQKAAQASMFRKIGRSSPLCGRGRIYLQEIARPDLEVALRMFEDALDLNDFATSKEAADCHFLLAETLSRMDTKKYLDTIIAECERAVALDPQHASAHVLLGVSYFKRDRNVIAAEAHIKAAMLADPQYKWSYFHLGNIRLESGREAEAIDLYQQALRIDHDFEIVRQKLQLLITQ
jgi:tetratricopeptide (TPR) repeat protein